MFEDLRQAALLASQKWRVMVKFSVIMWLLRVAVLMPAGTWILHHLSALPGDVIVGNYNFLPWLLSLKGILFVVLVGPITLLNIVLHTGGLHLIAYGQYSSETKLRKIFVHTLTLIPNAIRYCMSLVWIYGVIILFGLIGFAVGKLFILGKYDINYYMTHTPPEWYIAITVAVAWGAPVALFMIYATCRFIYVLPLWVSQNYTVREAYRISWEETRGKVKELLFTFGACLISLGLAYVAIERSTYLVTGLLLKFTQSSLQTTVFLISQYLIVTFILETVVFCLGLAWFASLRALYFSKEVERKAIAQPHDQESIHLGKQLRKYARPKTLMASLLVLITGSILLSGYFLNKHSPNKRPLIIAHRTGAAYAPENSLVGLDIVIEQGVSDFFEIDVQLTKDKKLVVTHDKDLMKTGLDPQKIEDSKYRHLKKVDIGETTDEEFEGEKLKLLKHFLKKARKHEIPMIIEFKGKENTELIGRTIEEVKEYKMEEQVILMSLELADVHTIKKLAPNMAVGYFASVELGDLTRLEVDVLALKDWLNKPALVRKIQGLGMEVYPWTIDDPGRILELIEIGVDGIITNDPVLAHQVIERYWDVDPRKRLLFQFRQFWKLFDQLD